MLDQKKKKIPYGFDLQLIFLLVGLRMYKILMFSCNRYCLDQLNINYTYSYQFDDCNGSEDHKIFWYKV